MTRPLSPSFPAIFTQNALAMRQFDRDLITVLDAWAMNCRAILDGGISVADNMDVSIITYTSDATPGTQTTVAHGLGKTPTGYIPISKDKAADVYNTAAADNTNLYLKCSVASATVKLLVF